MTWDEFDGTWLPGHIARFTGIRDWLAKVTRGSEAPSYEAILRGWYRVLQDVDLAAAVRASEAMHRGEIEEPKGFDRHPKEIRSAAGISSRSSKAPWLDVRHDAAGNQTFACLLCQDWGWVECWHPATVAAIARDGLPKDRLLQPIYACVFRCTCRAGDCRPQIGESPRYNPKLALKLTGDTSSPEEQQRLLDWIAQRTPARPDNYEPAFEEFSGREP